MRYFENYETDVAAYKKLNLEHTLTADYSELSILEKNALIYKLNTFSLVRFYPSEENMYGAPCLALVPGTIGVVKCNENLTPPPRLIMLCTTISISTLAMVTATENPNGLTSVLSRTHSL